MVAQPLSPDILDTVLERMAGGEILTVICKDIGVPFSRIAYRETADPEFAASYARARLACADAIAFDAVAIPDAEKDANRGRVRSDARKWLAGKLYPDRYGDKIGVDAKLTVTWEKLVLETIASRGKTIEHEAAPQQIASETQAGDTTSGVCDAPSAPETPSTKPSP